MWFISNKTNFSKEIATIRENYYNTVHAIEEDIFNFVQQEMIIYKRDPEHKSFNNSVIANFALFDLTQLNTENGVAQMKNLLEDKHDQSVNHRLAQQLVMLYIRYGINQVDEIGTDALKVITGIYDLIPSVVNELDTTYNTFWLQPFVAKAWNDIVNNVTPQEQVKNN